MIRIAIDDFRDFRRQRHIDAQSKKQARLAPTLLLTNETGVDGTVPEKLDEALFSKVEFDVPLAGYKAAELLFYVNADRSTRDKPMRLAVNGHRLSHRQDPAKMLTGGWDRHPVPARHLVQGANELVFGEHGVLHVDPGPGRASSRSFDGGQTWHAGALGDDGTLTGEYLVRLRLKGHPPQGWLLSPVYDLADPAGQGTVAPDLRLKNLRLHADTQTPQGTRIAFELRSGSTPDFDPRHWSPWQARQTLSRPGRFVQFRAVLGTKSAAATPVLSRVVLEAQSYVARPKKTTVTLLEIDQPVLARSSYDFAYLRPHPRVTRLLKQHRLEDVIAAGQTELEQFALLRDWIHSQWLGWQSDKYPYCPPWDPLEILETTKGNWGYGMCTHYGAVFAGCASALGFVARVLVVDHHCLAEVWSEELQKWILQDAGPCREYDASYEVNGVPLNALELHRAVAEGQAKKIKANKLPQGKAERMDRYVETFCRFGIPPRNDHLTRAEPAEKEHGATQYHWDGYLWWSDDLAPRYAEYSLQTTREADFYWSVNQTRLYPRQTGKDGVLHVDLETVTPNFSHFLVRRDDGDWQQEQGPLTWELKPGENRLTVRAVNAFGRQGRAASVRVRWENAS